jgi:hypothetical protein
MDCGSKIVDDCVGVTLLNSGQTWDNLNDALIEQKFKRLAGEIVTVGQFLITTFLSASSSSMSINMVKGLNALRCAFSSGFINVWMLFGSLYFAARQFKQQEQLTDKLDEYYPYVCTCKKDVTSLQKLMAVSGQASEVFASCTEE